MTCAIIVLWHKVTLTFAVVDYVKEITLMKTCKNGNMDHLSIYSPCL